MLTFSKLGEPLLGRLGNQLFQIAATIGIAERNSTGFVFPEWKYSSYFENQLPTGICADYKKYVAKGTNYYDVVLEEGNWDLEGFFQSEKFFIHSSQTVVYYLQPAKTALDYIQGKYGHLLHKKTCSIHIRRGDYVQQKHYFPPQPLTYYREAITLFDVDTIFLVFSDDVSWCKMHLIGERFFYVENETDIIDLFLMSRCNDHILSNSSFSWWGAWLNPSSTKRIICPERWFGPAAGSNYGRDIFSDNFQKLVLPKSFLEKNISKLGHAVIYRYYKVYKATLSMRRCIKHAFRKYKRTLYKNDVFEK